jgi:hypothetical protein
VMTEIREDCWKEVPKKKRANKMRLLRNREQVKYRYYLDALTPNSSQEKSNTIEKIGKCQNEIMASSKFFSSIKEIFRPWIRPSFEEPEDSSSEIIVDIVCYGIGSISSSKKSQYQFALVLLLRSLLQIPGQIYIYDPILNVVDKDVVIACGCTLVQNNEEGKRKVERKTLFFMPHCGRQLYSNVLWANWSPSLLQNVVIFGNSFALYEQIAFRHKPNNAKYLFKILPYVDEIPIEDTFAISGIFNNQSLLWFTAEKLQNIDSNFWLDATEEMSDPNDSEIISLSSVEEPRHEQSTGRLSLNSE